MSLLETLYGQPVRTAAPGRVETPLGPWPEAVSDAKRVAQRQNAIAGAAKRGNKNKEKS